MSQAGKLRLYFLPSPECSIFLQIEMNAMYNVLRFKRKIASDVPLDAIVVSPKRSKPNDSSGIIFKYAGVASDDASVEKTLKRALDDSKEDHIPSEITSVEPSDCQENGKLSFTSVSVSKKRKLGSDILLVEFDDSCPITTKSKPMNYDLLTCNGLKMMRNKLSMETSSSYTSDGDDLFDVYYNVWQDSENTDLGTCFEPLDLLYIAPYENDFIGSGDEAEKNVLEESDSNDENYYTNDYPDSPGSRSSGSDSTGSDIENSYGTRMYWGAPNDLHNDESDDDPTEFFQRYSDHVQSDASLSD